MSLLWVVIGTVFQLSLSMFLFMIAAFAGGGYANGRSLSQLQLAVLDSALWVLPGSAVLSAAIVAGCYFVGGSAHAYWWYVLPFALTVAYFTYTSTI